MNWAERADAAIERYEGGETRELDQRQLTQLGNAAWAAGLALLMAGRTTDAAEWLRRRPFDRTAEMNFQRWGLVALIALAAVISFLDIQRLATGQFLGIK